MEGLVEKINRNDRNKQVLFMATAAAVAVAVPLLVWSSYRRTKKDKRHRLQQHPRKRRSWSFTSEGMRLGVFPPAVQAPPTVINTALYFSTSDDLPSVEALVDQVVTPLLQYDRLAHIFDHGGVLRPSKTGYEAQDLIRTIVLPHTNTNDDGESEGESVLHKTMFELFSQSLDSNRAAGGGGAAADCDSNHKELPMWEFVRLENSNNRSGRSVLLFRVHHCIGDGLSLVSIFDKILTKVDGSRAESRVTKALLEKKPTTRPSLSSLLKALGQVLTLDKSPFDDATVFLQQRNNPHRSLVPANQQKHAIALFPPVPLEYIKALRQAAPVLGTTVNDLLMCAVSQAIYEFCKFEKDEILADKQDQLQCRALLPVSLPRSTATTDSFTALRNLFCMVSADLSVGYSTVHQRLQHIHATTCQLKTSPTAFVQLWLQNNVLCHLPYAVGRQTAHDIFARHSLVLTNVPGPEHECLIANCLVQELQLFFPNVIPQVDLISYAGTIYGNFVYDPTLLPHGDRFATLYAKALVTLGTEWGLKDDQIPSALTQAAAKELS